MKKDGTPQTAEPQIFAVVDEYTTFSAEYTFKDDDVHFHFFMTPEAITRVKEYWAVDFPTCLDKVAREHFGFEFPRIQASLVVGVLRYGQDEKEEPQDSWWMIVQELEDASLDGDSIIIKFLEKLDQALENATRR